ncbi:hypothetical protein BDW59DRAFT_181963 [Aspergillus cavernicola]|uniref:Zn(2)-C6 fungal-type domain-containing protein n=1 Tax=Aspergillus cavernicola TaxID=176166 RepID=A0ABR4HTE8_9EURO
MPGVPSNKSCERCKKRHMKCDETRPHCQRCADAGVECSGYVQTRKFIDQGASVRRRYAPYQENVPRPSETRNTSSQRHHSPKPLQNAGSSPGAQAQSHTQWYPPSMDAQDQPPVEPGVAAGTDALDHLAQIDETTGPASRPASTTAFGSVSRQSGLNTHVGEDQVVPDKLIADPPQRTAVHDSRQPSPHSRVPGSASPSQGTERDNFQDIFSELMTGTQHEISFLVRHYAESLASWLDISDTGRFFQAYVPVRAINEQSLRFAIAALSAKHLAKMNGIECASMRGMFTSPATMELYPNSEQVDWSLKAANYYYLAISHMNSSISDYGSVSTSAVLESPIATVNRWLNFQLEKDGGTPNSLDETSKQAENLLATSTILTWYKLLDEPGESWQSYLTGVKPLFSQLVDLTANIDASNPSFSPGVTAVFWNFARMDYLSSYYNKLPTHLDPGDIPLWRAAGLSLDDQGNSCPPNQTRSGRVPSSIEDMAANVLTRLLNKVSNFLAASKRSQLEHWVGQSSPESSSPPSPDSRPTAATWLKLSFEFQSWIERIPETFRPCLRLERPTPFSSPPQPTPMPFPEIFYSLTSCAATMQQYHFGRLALCLNRPSDEVAAPSTAFDRLQAYRELTKEVDYRCRELCGIALGRPQSGARVQMITILYAVGQCLEKPDERQIVINLLHGIQADLGWSTSSQVEKLQK